MPGVIGDLTGARKRTTHFYIRTMLYSRATALSGDAQDADEFFLTRTLSNHHELPPSVHLYKWFQYVCQTAKFFFSQELRTPPKNEEFQRGSRPITAFDTLPSVDSIS